MNVDQDIEEKVVKIQRAVRHMLKKKNFRVNLYKLILFKNIVENKVHREKMSMLYAFEQMIINTELEEEYGEEYGEEMFPGSGAIIASSDPAAQGEKRASYIDEDGNE